MGSLDFFKSCATNVRVVENLFQLQYSLRRPLRSISERRALHGVVRDLRKQNVLCAVVGEELLIFGTDPDASEVSNVFGAHKCDLNLEDSGHVSADPRKRVGDGTMLKDVLLLAIEASISFALAQEQAFLHVSLWTWLYQSAEADNARGTGTLLRLHINLADNGTLYISTMTEACSLRPTSGPERSQSMHLAPSGRHATLAADPSTKNDGTDRRINGVVLNDAWKSNVTQALGAEGIHINGDDGWTAVDIVDRGEEKSVLWPTRLCLTTRSRNASEDCNEWRRWVADTSLGKESEGYKDPIAEAEELFIQASSVHLTPGNDDQMPEMGPSMNSNAMLIESPLATSPPFNQRLVDQQAAMSGIYPTPPDGLLPAHMLGHTSTSDAHLDTLQHDQSSRLLSSDDTQHDPRSQSFSAEPQSYASNNLAVDDLFGDVGGLDDEFGANEVGDADFDYFDEPDDVANAEKDVEMIDDTSPATAVAANPEEVLTVQDSIVEERNLAPDAESVELHGPHGLNEIAVDNHIDDSATIAVDKEQTHEAEQPLSPFRIRERLLPPPIPASTAQQQQQTNHLRRKSTFDAMNFNKDLDLNARYTRYSNVYSQQPTISSDGGGPNIGLPYKRKRDRIRRLSQPDSGVDDLENTQSSEDEDSFGGSTSMDEDEGGSPPAKLPWDTKKRKRNSADVDTYLPANDEAFGDGSEPMESAEAIQDLCGLWTTSGTFPPHHRTSGTSAEINEDLESIERVHELSKTDLVYIAQIVSEQAVTVTKRLAVDIQHFSYDAIDKKPGIQSTAAMLATKTIDDVLPNVQECDLSKVTLVKEPPPRTPSLSGKTPQLPLQPRQHAREGGMLALGPDYFAIAPPYVHVQRSSEAWNLLPPALSFWSELGLAPANGAKDITVLSVIAENEDLRGRIGEFLVDLKRAYEGCKMGSLQFATRVEDDVDGDAARLDGVAVFQSLSGQHSSLSELLRAYGQECAQLGRKLAQTGHIDPKRTIVICLVNVFGVDALVQQHLCACFLLLCKAYHESTPKAHRNAPRSDIDLQILPASLIASFDGPVILNSHQMEALATEIYDRCPPSANAPSDPSPIWSILAAPAVELVSPPPKRISFQIAPDAPSDLLHEGSILHLAYAFSADGEWITVSWIDSTARYRRIFSACLRGKSFLDVASDIWAETADILSEREVTWRVLIVAVGGDPARIDEDVQTCWKDIVSRKTRKQNLHVTLLSVSTDPPLQLSPSTTMDTTAKVANNETTPGASFLTPVSTPQAANFTVSPDASAQTNAPLTPAPSDTVTSIVENDPDAHLVDTADETWGMLLAPSYNSQPASQRSAASAQASGILFQRGDSGNAHLDALGVDIHWDIRVRPNGVVDEGPKRQNEATLREVLRMYRNLSVLTAAKMPRVGREGVAEVDFMPVHVFSAVQGANALNGYLKGVA